MGHSGENTDGSQARWVRGSGSLTPFASVTTKDNFPYFSLLSLGPLLLSLDVYCPFALPSLPVPTEEDNGLVFVVGDVRCERALAFLVDLVDNQMGYGFLALLQ